MLRQTFRTLCISLLFANATQADDTSKRIVKPNVETHRLGRVDVPDTDTLMKLHLNQYTLCGAQGKRTQLQVSRVKLPHRDGMSLCDSVEAGQGIEE